MNRLYETPKSPIGTLVRSGVLVLIAMVAHTSPGSCAWAAQPDFKPVREISWPDFLGQFDLQWEQLPRQWNEGAFTGNGQLGMMISASLDHNRMDFHLGRMDVTDHRLAPDQKTSLGVRGAGPRYHYPRLDIGRIVFYPSGKILSGTMRQDLWNAEVRGTIQTDLGTIHFRALTLRDRMVQMVEVETTETTNASTPAPIRWEFIPGDPSSPRIQVIPDPEGEMPDFRDLHRTYQRNPAPKLRKIDDVDVCEQPLLAGGDYATAWLIRKGAKNKSTLFVSTMNEVPSVGRSAKSAVLAVQQASKASAENLTKEHRAWWHHFYQASFLSIPDTRLEAFYWIQLYKMGAGVRENGPALDLAGPWFRINQWPGMWWNLNMQLTYWPFAPANQMALSHTLIDYLDNSFDGVLENGWLLGAGDGLGDCTWALHNYWLHYRYAGDRKALIEKWLPMARKVFARYEKLLLTKEDGSLHLAPTESPEFKGFAKFPNTNYNLALLRWLAAAMWDVTEPEGAPSSERSRWKQILTDLIPPPQNAEGLMIASNQPLDESHRHFSHLIGLYPLFVFNPEEALTRKLLEKSIHHWLNIQNPDGSRDRCGFTLTVAASIWASLGHGEEAVACLNAFLDNSISTQQTAFASRLLPNTFYAETQGRNPTIETPLSAANAIIELLLQSQGGKIRIFPSVPGSWESAVFDDLRAQGGFLVSAERRSGKTRWVAVHSLAGEPLTIKVADWNGPVTAMGDRTFSVSNIADGEYRVDLHRGERILLFPAKESQPSPIIRPVSSAAGPFFGVKKDGHLKEFQEWKVSPKE